MNKYKREEVFDCITKIANEGAGAGSNVVARAVGRTCGPIVYIGTPMVVAVLLGTAIGTVCLAVKKVWSWV